MVLFWSANYIIGKVALRELPPLLAGALRIAFGGVGILNLLPVTGPPGSQPTVVGDVFAFLAAATFALFTVIGKTVSLRLSGITVNTFSYLTGAVALAPIAIWQGRGFAFARVS